jgi:PhzF family phenazine biosynthesis protein
MPIDIVVVDAFTDRPFSGNPAAVCLLTEPASDMWMHSIAAEMNLSETAFIVPTAGGWSLRWFTPTVEVDLCGHATLASAHVLWADGHVAAGVTIAFHTKSGVLTCKRAIGGPIEMDFPADPPTLVKNLPAALISALGVSPIAVARGRSIYLVEVASEGDVLRVAPDFSKLRGIDAVDFIVTAQSEKEDTDIVSRFFAPAVGINEDPVTGAAHCTLACYWGDKLGRDTLVGYQASARGGTVLMRRREMRIILGGQAVTVMRSTLLV